MKTLNGNNRRFLKPEAAKAVMAQTNTLQARLPGVPIVNRLSTQPPVLYRIWAVLVLKVLSPKPMMRFREWLIIAPLHARSFVKAMLGPRVDSETHGKRMAECMKCPMAARILTYRAPYVLTYCKSCRCPNWPLAELTYKNRLQNWACPAGKFPGRPEPRAWEGVRESEAELQSEIGIQAQKEQGGRGCG